MNQNPPLSGRHPLRVDISERFAQQLRQAADDERRTVSGYVRNVLVKHLQAESRPAEPDR